MKVSTKLVKLGSTLKKQVGDKVLRSLWATYTKHGVKAFTVRLKEEHDKLYLSLYTLLGRKPKVHEWYVVLHPSNTQLCLECGKDVKWSPGKKCYRDFCSFKCSMSSAKTKSARDATMKKIYGTTNAFASAEVMLKIKSIMLERYGVDNPSKSRELLAKKVLTSLEKRGVTHHMKDPQFVKQYQAEQREKFGGLLPMQTAKVKRKQQLALFKNHGVLNPMHSPSIREKHKETLLKNHGVDNIFKDGEYLKSCYTASLGVNHPMKSNAVKKGMRERSMNKYGVPYPMQDPEVHARQVDASKLKKEVSILGIKCAVRGYEDIVLRKIENSIKRFAVAPKKIPRILYKYNGKEHYYFPDIKVKTKGGVIRIIEVKSEYTLTTYKNNSAKFKAATALCAELGYEFWVALVNKRLDSITWVKNPTSIRAVTSKAKQRLKR